MKPIPFEPLLFPINKKYINSSMFLEELSTASAKIGRLNEKLATSAWQVSYAAMHMTKIESLYSTKIEGTQTTLEAVYEAEIESGSKSQRKDEEEVIRYQRALSNAAKQVINHPITCKMMKEIHKILLSGNIRKNSNFIAGEFRQQQNRVGGHIPPIATMVDKYMSNLENYINEARGYEDNMPPIIKAALVHAQFETIHPFPDGNGRVGRVLIPIYLYKQGIIDSPHFFLSKELERNKMRYYAYLQGTRELTQEGFTNWIIFFLNSVSNQIDNDLAFINSLEKLADFTLEEVRRHINSNNVEAVIKAMFKFPIFTVETLHRETVIPKSSLRKYLSILERCHIIFRNNQLRNITYYFSDLLDIIL